MTPTPPPPPIPQIEATPRRRAKNRRKPNRSVWIWSAVAVAIVALGAVSLGRSKPPQQAAFMPGNALTSYVDAMTQEPDSLRGLSVVGRPTWREATDGNRWLCTVAFDVRNDSSETIAKLAIQVEHALPDRTVPHGYAEDYVDVSGGIEPGETRRVEASVYGETLKMLRLGTEVAPGHIIRGVITGGETTEAEFACNVPFTCAKTRSTQPQVDPAMVALLQTPGANPVANNTRPIKIANAAWEYAGSGRKVECDITNLLDETIVTISFSIVLRDAGGVVIDIYESVVEPQLAPKATQRLSMSALVPEFGRQADREWQTEIHAGLVTTLSGNQSARTFMVADKATK